MAFTAKHSAPIVYIIDGTFDGCQLSRFRECATMKMWATELLREGEDDAASVARN